MRCNNEASIMAVADRVKAKMPDRVVVETTLRHSSASNGLAEREIGTVGEQLRTLRYDTQNRYKTRITPDSAIWPRMVSYAGFCVQEIVPFAETCQDLRLCRDCVTHLIVARIMLSRAFAPAFTIFAFFGVIFLGGVLRCRAPWFPSDCPKSHGSSDNVLLEVTAHLKLQNQELLQLLASQQSAKGR